MKATYVTTPPDKLRTEIILQERNVDIRRELLRKVGLDRVIKYGKVVNTQGNYKLIDMSPIFHGSGIEYAPYLLMQSPSTGMQHLEGVSPQCRTVEQAINWRSSEVAETWEPDLMS